jgi:hypothetical protein
MLDQSVGSHVPIHCAGSCPSHQREWAPWWGPTRLSVLPEGAMHPLGEAKNVPRGLGAPVITLQGSSEAEIVPDGAQESGALMTS